MNSEAQITAQATIETIRLDVPSIPQVSIGMPVYNGARFIREALDSLLAQTFTDYELIISDNASTDGTEAICREYAARDTRIRYVRQAENIGAFNNFEFVLVNAISECFMWMAADDCVKREDHLEKLLDKIRPDIDYVFPDVAVIDSVGKVMQSRIMLVFENAITQFDFVKGSLKVNSHQIYSLFRTSKLREDFRFLKKCNNLPCFGEGLFVHVISADRKGVFVPEALKLYRRHGANVSSTVPAKDLLPAFVKYSIASVKYLRFTFSLRSLRKNTQRSITGGAV